MSFFVVFVYGIKVYGIKKIKINKSIWRKYRKVFENLLTNREHGVILCTEKNESETEFWLFFRLILQI